MDPVVALKEIARLIEADAGEPRRAMAFRSAAATLEDMDAAEYEERVRDRSFGDVPGIGPSTLGVINDALAGREPQRLQQARREAVFAPEPSPLLDAIRGELHCHTRASDGSASLQDMVDAERALGRDYLVVTDHSPRLRVAHGLDAARLAAQLDEVASLDAESAPFRVLAGIEVDILDDGSLDQTPEMLGRLDCAVASVHSKLTMDADAMTRRMVGAVSNPLMDVLGHCTGRLVAGGRGTRPPSRFDAEVVFAACAMFDKAVEINARPERLDPPDDLLLLASELGCLFSIDTDAHAPGQLSWTTYGVHKAEECGIAPERIVNTWSAQRLQDWTASHRRA